MGCAVGALLFSVSGSAFADTGGTSYSTSNTKTSARPATSTSPHPSRERFVHLGDRIPVRQGMHGHDVKVLQDFFNRIGMHVTIDGEFGHGTWAAQRRFERRAGRPIDGVLDSSDLSRLRRVVSKGGWGTLKSSQAPPTLPTGSRARLNGDGTATAPAGAPAAVQAIIEAGNEIATKPYRYGGGHGNWNDSGYDCSGSVSYALHGAGLLQRARDSSGFETFGETGPGEWVTIYANAGHAYMVVAGLRFDTSGRTRSGSRWQSVTRSSSGYVVRHPAGL
jgi:cell wall-associated NlpC family hydrolase